MKKNNGSALIIILFVMSIILILSVSLAVSANTEYLMARSYFDSKPGYYIAEAGMERAKFVIEQGIMKKLFLNSSIKALTDDMGTFISDAVKRGSLSDVSENSVKSYIYNTYTPIINSSIYEYLLNSFNDDMDFYQGSYGIDSIEFKNGNNGVEAYYRVSILDPDVHLGGKINMTACSFIKNISRSITSEYTIPDIKDIVNIQYAENKVYINFSLKNTGINEN